MRNAFIINSDGSYTIFINKKDGAVLEAIVDEDIFKTFVDSFKGSWLAYLYKDQCFVRGYYKVKGMNSAERPMLHRLVANPKHNEFTLFKNHNTLDCRRQNLINIPAGVDPEEYLKEQTKEEPVKGVSFHKSKKKWEASPFYEGTRYRLGYWPQDQLAKANEAVTEFRKIGPEAYYNKYPKGGKK